MVFAASSASLFRYNVDGDQDSRHLPTVRSPVRDVWTFHPLLTGTPDNLGTVVTNFRELATDYIGRDRTRFMAMMGEDCTRLHRDFADA